jgi:hypothetical protein
MPFARPGEGAGPCRGRSQCRSACLPDHRLRKVSVRSEEEGKRGEEEAGNDHGQGSEVSSGNGRSRLRLSHEACARVAAGWRQGESHDLVSRPRDDAPRTGRAHSGEAGKDLVDVGEVEARPRMEGNQMFIILGQRDIRVAAAARSRRRPRIRRLRIIGNA